MGQVITRKPLTAKASARCRGGPTRDLWWKRWHWTGCCPFASVLLSHHRSVNATYSFSSQYYVYSHQKENQAKPGNLQTKRYSFGHRAALWQRSTIKSLVFRGSKLINPRCRILVERLTIPRRSTNSKFHAFYRTRRFITVLTRAH